jgi:hypothetical protein
VRYYRCYFIDAQGRIRALEEIEAPDDEAAKERALELFSGPYKDYPMFELYERARLVERRTRGP